MPYSRLKALALAALAAVAIPVVGPSPAPAAASAADVAGRSARPLATIWGDDDTGQGRRSTLIAGSWVPQHDLGSMWYVTKNTGAQDVWGKSDPTHSNRKLTGHGVGIAVIDTGVSTVWGLDGPGKVVNGPDLSLEAQAVNTRYVDGYGHGTHMAGIIAGRDAAVVPGNEKDDKYFVGMAPDARLINVKVGSGDGGADVSQVIAAIDWVRQHRAEHNIRVLNLSYGTRSTQPATSDPLAHAVENARRAGIVVVVAAGNDGESGGTTLTMPAVDPYVLAVGSSDHHGSPAPEYTRVGSWTNDGTGQRRPDLIAPGKSVVSLRVPGSLADVAHPEGLVHGDPTGRMFRGTGTSQSAAVVSGAAALLLQRKPALTPDQVKGLLRESADRLANSNDATQGAGMLDVKGAVELLEKGSRKAYRQTWSPSSGLGSLDAARGGTHVADPDGGDVLRGEQDIFGVPWDAASWAAASTQGRSWTGGEWRGSVWTGAGWSAGSWASSDWSRRSWSGLDWSRRSWSAMTFQNGHWSGDDWQRRSWSADSFARRSWSTGDWVAAATW